MERSPERRRRSAGTRPGPAACRAAGEPAGRRSGPPARPKAAEGRGGPAGERPGRVKRDGGRPGRHPNRRGPRGSCEEPRWNATRVARARPLGPAASRSVRRPAPLRRVAEAFPGLPNERALPPGLRFGTRTPQGPRRRARTGLEHCATSRALPPDRLRLQHPERSGSEVADDRRFDVYGRVHRHFMSSVVPLPSSLPHSQRAGGSRALWARRSRPVLSHQFAVGGP